MLIPKYTLRQLMLGMVIAAFVCTILGFAAGGNVLAYGLGVALLGLVIPLATMALVYWVLVIVYPSNPGASLPIGPNKPGFMDTPRPDLNSTSTPSDESPYESSAN